MTVQDIVLTGSSMVEKDRDCELRFTINKGTPAITYTGKHVHTIAQLRTTANFWRYAFILTVVGACVYVMMKWMPYATPGIGS